MDGSARLWEFIFLCDVISTNKDPLNGILYNIPIESVIEFSQHAHLRTGGALIVPENFLMQLIIGSGYREGAGMAKTWKIQTEGTEDLPMPEDIPVPLKEIGEKFYGVSGIYFAWRKSDNVLQYVGRSKNIGSRVYGKPGCRDWPRHRPELEGCLVNVVLFQNMKSIWQSCFTSGSYGQRRTVRQESFLKACQRQLERLCLKNGISTLT